MLHYSQNWSGFPLLSQVTHRIRAFTSLQNNLTTIETCRQKDLGFDCRNIIQIKCAYSTGRLEEIDGSVNPQFHVVTIFVIVGLRLILNRSRTYLHICKILRCSAVTNMTTVRNFGAIQCHNSCVIQCACTNEVDSFSTNVTYDDAVVIFILFIAIKTR
jgi:hypothetical protein